MGVHPRELAMEPNPRMEVWKMIVPCPKADFQVLSWFLVVYLCPTNTSWVVSTHPSIWKIWVKMAILPIFGVKIPKKSVSCHHQEYYVTTMTS